MSDLPALLRTLGHTGPLPVQTAVWGPFRAGSDLAVEAATGSGKTLAYLLPLVAGWDLTSRRLQALVLVPTQELAVQVDHELRRLGSWPTALLMGGVNPARQVAALKAHPVAAVGTPGRVRELLEQKKLTGHYLRTVVLDEADRLAEPPLAEHVAAILKTTLKTRQTALFSATLPERTLTAAGAWLRDPVVLRLDRAAPVPAGIEHLRLAAEPRDRADLLRKVLHSLAPRRCLVFLNRPEQIEDLAAKLRFHGLTVATLHGSLDKAGRHESRTAFLRGAAGVLLASDLAARGLDLPGIDLVVQLEVPQTAAEYLHRCGRTGRAGAPGRSLVFAHEGEGRLLDRFEAELGLVIRAHVLRQGRLQARGPA